MVNVVSFFGCLCFQRAFHLDVFSEFFNLSSHLLHLLALNEDNLLSILLSISTATGELINLLLKGTLQPRFTLHCFIPQLLLLLNVRLEAGNDLLHFLNLIVTGVNSFLGIILVAGHGILQLGYFSAESTLIVTCSSL